MRYFPLILALGHVVAFDTRGDAEYHAMARHVWETSRAFVAETDPLFTEDDEEAKQAVQAANAVIPVPNTEAQALKKNVLNPMWAVDRAALRLTSLPVIEQGFWREVAVNFERLRLSYGRYVATLGNKHVPDRFIARKLRSVTGFQTCKSFTHMSVWHRSIAKSMASMMLLVYPVKSYYLGQGRFVGQMQGDLKEFTHASTVVFYSALYRKRLETRLARERNLPFSLNNPMTYLRQHLDFLDTFRPYEKDVQQVCQLIKPESRQVGKNSRLWKSSNTKTYRYVMGALLQCLGEKTLSGGNA